MQYSPSAYRVVSQVDKGLSWTNVAYVNLQRPTLTYWRDMLKVGNQLFASACCKEDTSNERFMKLFTSADNGTNWFSLGNPFDGPYGEMQAIYQMCVTESNLVFAGCQPDSTILRWTMPTDPSGVICISSLVAPLALTKCGLGDFTISGSNSFLGSITVSEGYLRISGTLSVSRDVLIEGNR